MFKSHSSTDHVYHVKLKTNRPQKNINSLKTIHQKNFMPSAVLYHKDKHINVIIVSYMLMSG